jgi:Putative transposase DNA-binding domain
LNDLKSIQDQHLRVALDALGAWSKTNQPPAGIDLGHVSEWRNPWRLLRLYRVWKECRVPGDDAAFLALTAWKERHDHLHEWEANLRDQVIRHRKEIYRRFVAELLRTHGRVFLEDLQIRAMARKDRPEEDNRNYSGGMRVVAAVSLLGRLIRERGDCERVSARHTTRECSWCGHAKEWDAAENIMHRCEACGRLFDQDRNAARNILRRGLMEIESSCREVAEMAAV